MVSNCEKNIDAVLHVDSNKGLSKLNDLLFDCYKHLRNWLYNKVQDKATANEIFIEAICQIILKRKSNKRPFKKSYFTRYLNNALNDFIRKKTADKRQKELTVEPNHIREKLNVSPSQLFFPHYEVIIPFFEKYLKDENDYMILELLIFTPKKDQEIIKELGVSKSKVSAVKKQMNILLNKNKEELVSLLQHGI